MEFPKLSRQRRRFLSEAAGRYHAALTPEACQYLTSRGITKEVAEVFQLGYVDQPLAGHEPMRGFISIPYRSHAGPTAIRFRRLGDEGEGKRWLAEAGRPDPLFNVLDLHRAEPYMAICEGQTDTITLSGLVGVPAVGISGAGKWESHWSRCFTDYETVFILPDPDEAGSNATKKLVERLSDNVKVISLPADVNTTYCAEGAETIRKAMGL